MKRSPTEKSNRFHRITTLVVIASYLQVNVLWAQTPSLPLNDSISDFGVRISEFVSRLFNPQSSIRQARSNEVVVFHAPFDMNKWERDRERLNSQRNSPDRASEERPTTTVSEESIQRIVSPDQLNRPSDAPFEAALTKAHENQIPQTVGELAKILPKDQGDALRETFGDNHPVNIIRETTVDDKGRSSVVIKAQITATDSVVFARGADKPILNVSARPETKETNHTQRDAAENRENKPVETTRVTGSIEQLRDLGFRGRDNNVVKELCMESLANTQTVSGNRLISHEEPVKNT